MSRSHRWSSKIANSLVSLAITSFVFALLIKYIPETRISWRVYGRERW